MSFEAGLVVLQQKIPSVINDLETEEATKNALIMPFIQALGYDVFNPKEVVPEFVVDERELLGHKKGQKVDYAIKRDGEVIMIIECKAVRTDLAKAEMGQLVQYFHVTRARIGILTNGVNYWFFSDLESPNVMDKRPFLELDLSESRPRKDVIAQVRKLAKEDFNLDQILGVANELKAISEFKKLLDYQLEEPQEDFVKFFWSHSVPAGSRFTSAAREKYFPLVHRAFRDFIHEQVDRRLEEAIKEGGSRSRERPPVEPGGEDGSDGVVTTEEELEGFRIVRAIACRVVPSKRVAYRDNKSYCAILLDNHKWKPICRLWFNSAQKYLGTFSADKQETKIPIQDVSDIYQHAEALLETIRNYEASSPSPKKGDK